MMVSGQTQQLISGLSLVANTAGCLEDDVLEDGSQQPKSISKVLLIQDLVLTLALQVEHGFSDSLWHDLTF